MSEPPARDPLKHFFGSALFALGILLVALCGSCTAFFTIGSLAELAGGHSGGEFPPSSILAMAAIFGGPPILMGALLIWVGRRLRRAARPPPSAPPPG